jgi:hypothetical protein
MAANPLQDSIDIFNEKGTLTYLPRHRYTGIDKFKFRVIDDKGSEKT